MMDTSNEEQKLFSVSSNSSITGPVPGGVVTTQNISTVIRPKGNTNSLQFVKIQTPELSKKAAEQIKLADEKKISKEKIKEVEEEWQNNLLNWKSKRRQQLTRSFDYEPNNESSENNDCGTRKVKTFAEMLEQRAKSGNRLGFHLQRYVDTDEDEDVDKKVGGKLENEEEQGEDEELVKEEEEDDDDDDDDDEKELDKVERDHDDSVVDNNHCNGDRSRDDIQIQQDVRDTVDHSEKLEDGGNDRSFFSQQEVKNIVDDLEKPKNQYVDSNVFSRRGVRDIKNLFEQSKDQLNNNSIMKKELKEIPSRFRYSKNNCDEAICVPPKQQANLLERDLVDPANGLDSGFFTNNGAKSIAEDLEPSQTPPPPPLEQIQDPIDSDYFIHQGVRDISNDDLEQPKDRIDSDCEAHSSTSSSYNQNEDIKNLNPLPETPKQPPVKPNRDERDRTVLTVSGKKRCSSCREELGRGAAAFVVESLSLVYHTNCFRCSVCHMNLSNGFRGVDVRVHAGALHCQNCYSKDGLNYSRV